MKWAAAFAAVSIAGALVMWGFTVDDALITCRVAWHLARGVVRRLVKPAEYRAQ